MKKQKGISNERVGMQVLEKQEIAYKIDKTLKQVLTNLYILYLLNCNFKNVLKLLLIS